MAQKPCYYILLPSGVKMYFDQLSGLMKGRQTEEFPETAAGGAKRAFPLQSAALLFLRVTAK